jgi:hypothetical protein
VTELDERAEGYKRDAAIFAALEAAGEVPYPDLEGIFEYQTYDLD